MANLSDEEIVALLKMQEMQCIVPLKDGRYVVAGWNGAFERDAMCTLDEAVTEIRRRLEAGRRAPGHDRLAV